MTFEQFLSLYNEQFVEVAGSPGAINQCVDLANAYLRDVLNRPIVEWTNARDFPSKLPDFEWIENTPEAIPERGDIIIWQHDKYGHISIFIQGGINSFTSFDQNWPVGSPAHYQQHNYLSPRVAGWLRPPKGSMADEKIYTEAQMTEVRLARDANYNNWQEEKDEHDKTKRELMELQGRYNTLADEHDKCQPLGEPILIYPSVKVANLEWDINGVQVDSNGLVTANYARKK